jgi:ATP-dependent protease ClpP protease subunit
LDQCSASITINGPITKADANAIRLILDGEARRTGKQIRPSVHISSEGGDVEAAMQIGRDLRRTEGTLTTDFPPQGTCYSACVLVAAGAVSRIAHGIGIHRPYFADATTGNLTEADLRYKKLMAGVRAYLQEMNMSDEVFQIMQSVGPDEIRQLSVQDARRLGFAGDDPAYEEARIAAKARRYGLTSAEYRQRQAKIDAICKNEYDQITTDFFERVQKCYDRTTDPIMWGVDRNTAEHIVKSVQESCPLPPETSGKPRTLKVLDVSSFSPSWDECVKRVGQTIKTGQFPALPPAAEAPKLPPGWRWLEEPGSK